MKQKLLNSFRLRALMLTAMLCAAFTAAWADTTYKLTQVTSVSASKKYVFEQDGYVMNNSVASSALQCTNTYKTTGLSGTESYVWTLESGSGGYYMKNVNLSSSQYLQNASSTSITLVGYTSTIAVWSFTFTDGNCLIQNTKNNSRFLGYTSSTSHAYKAYATSNLSSSSYPHEIKVYELVEETSSAVATTTTINSTGITNTDVYTGTAAGTLTATVTPTGESALSSPSITWSSSNTDVATVGETTGVVTLVAAGTTTITASYAGVTDTYQASSATYVLTVTDSTPIPTHTATFSVNGVTSTQDFAEGADITFPSNPTEVNGKTFVGWVTSTIDGTTNNAPTFVTSATMGNSNVTYYACFAAAEGNTETMQDALTSSVTAITTSTYTDFSNKYVSGGSSAVYAGNCAGSNSYIQLRTSSNTGLVSTTSGGIAKKVTVAWSSTSDRALQVYGSNTAYTGLSDIFDNDKKGTLLGTLTYGGATELTITGTYAYIGIKPDSGKSGASQLSTITIDWEISNITYSDYCTTVPQAVAVTNVSVDATASVNVGETTTLTATVSPNNATNKNVTWESSDESIATVDANGVVTGVAAGSTTITVTSVADNTKTASCTVTVTTVAVTGVSVDATASVNVGETTALTATVSPNNATNKNVTWTSSDETIATVNENGVVTGVAAGTATITVKSSEDASISATCTVTVSLVPGTEARPYTVAEAIDAIDNDGNVTDVYVGGKISQIDGYNSTYHSITYWISADGTTSNQFEVYSGKGINGANFSGMSDLEVGDQVVVKGNIKKYNEIYEFASNSQLVSRVEKPASDLAKTSDIVLDYLNNNTTADVTDYITSSSNGAYTFTVGDGTIIENADEIISALAVGSTTVTVNQAATLSYKAGSVVINVTVQDTRTAASTIPGINISTLAEGAADGTIEVVNPVKADEGATFSFESSDENVLLIIGNAYTVGNVGTATVTVTATPSNTNLYKPVVANFNVTVQAAVMSENEITLAASSGNTVYGTPLDVNYTVATGYDGTMSYTIANSAIADVAIGASAITFTPKAVGSTTVTISAPATGNFYAADDVTYTLTVTAPEGKTTAFEAGTVVLDFTQNEWNLPVTSTNGLTEEKNYTYNGITITLAASTKYYLSSATNGYLMLGKSGSTLTLPAFDKAVTQIDVEGTSGASTSVVQNIYVGETAVSTATTGAKDVTNEYIIDPDYQAAGNIYTLKVTNAYNTQITSITIHFKGITATLNANGYATFCSEYPLDFTEAESNGYSAWQIKDINGENITFEKITGSVKGGTGLFLMGTANETVTLSSVNSSYTLGDNMLIGTLAPTYVTAGEVYGLSGNQFVPSNAAGTIKAGKAYLDAEDVPSNVRSFTFKFEDPATGITETRTATREEVEGIFNLAGQRMSKMQRGINIVNGKKVLMK